MKFFEAISIADAISTRLIGWLGMGLATTDVVNPALLAINTQQAVALGIGGVLLATGRANVLINFIKKGLADAE